MKPTTAPEPVRRRPSDQRSPHDPPPTLFMADVAAFIASRHGFRPHRNTLRRWRSKGVGGVILRTVRVGNRFMTSPEWITEFFDATDQGREATTPAPSTAGLRIGKGMTREVAIAHERAMAQLKAEGLA